MNHGHASVQQSEAFARLQAVTGAGPTDPMFETLLAYRTSLGDYDFANGIKADNSWTALRITQWVTAMKPICGSAQMQQRYADTDAAPGPFFEATYGRAVTTDDLDAINASLTDLQLTPGERRDGTCLAILSSIEFIAL